QTDRALNALNKAQALEASEVDIYLIRAGILSMLERYDEAMDELNTALSLSENAVDVHMQIAMMLQSKGDFEGAIEHLKFCLEDNMEDQDALYELAFCYDVLDRHEESIGFYSHYIDR